MDKNITRRKFVKTTAAATAAVTIIPGIGCTGRTSTFDPKDLPTTKLGNTGIDIPIMVFGCGSRWMAVENDDKALEILEYGLDHGLYYWDTAANYGNERISSEERIGRLLKERRKEVFLVTKTDERTADKAKETIERSLERLQTDYVDMMHVHAIESVEDAEQLGEKGNVLEVLHKYRDEGIIKHIGFTGHSTAEGMKRAAELYDFEVMMIALNHNIPDGTEKFEEQAVPYAAKKGLGVIAIKVIRPRETIQGLTAEDLIRYALSLDHITAINIGTDNMEVLKENLALIRNFEPMDNTRMEEMKIALAPFYRDETLEWMHPGYVDGVADDLLLARTSNYKNRGL